MLLIDILTAEEPRNVPRGAGEGKKKIKTPLELSSRIVDGVRSYACDNQFIYQPYALYSRTHAYSIHNEVGRVYRQKILMFSISFNSS